MVAFNQAPIFPYTPSVQWSTMSLTLANTAKDGTGTTAVAFTADPTYGSRIDYVRVRALGTNSATAFRVFVNNGSAASNSINNVLFTEVTIAATTLSEAAALAETTIQMDLSLPPGYKILCTNGTSCTAGLVVSGVGGHYG